MQAKTVAPLVSLLVVAAVVTPVAATAARDVGAQGEAYTGTHVSFETTDDAIVDYAVANATVAESVTVRSTSETSVGADVGVDADLSLLTELAGAGLSLDASSSTEATVQSEGGATVRVHDNGHGSLVVASGGSSQYVLLDLSGGASAESEGDSRVVVTTEDGTKSAVLAVGNASVAVNEEGDVSAEVGQDGRLVVRSYADGRSETATEHEDMIVEGTATASVHVVQEGGEAVADTVTYGSNTTLEVTQSASGEVEMTAERTAHEGTVILTTVSKSAVDAAGDVQVAVDGEAAVEASSYGELEGAIGSDASRYMVESTSEASASANVLVAVNHFSQREVTVSSSDADGSTPTATDENSPGNDGGDSGNDGSNPDETSTSGQPGFGPVVALAALAGLVVALRRRA